MRHKLKQMREFTAEQINLVGIEKAKDVTAKIFDKDYVRVSYKIGRSEYIYQYGCLLGNDSMTCDFTEDSDDKYAITLNVRCNPPHCKVNLYND